MAANPEEEMKDSELSSKLSQSNKDSELDEVDRLNKKLRGKNGKGGKKSKNYENAYSKTEFNYATEEVTVKRLKHNKNKEAALARERRDDNKMVRDHERSVKHRWICLSKKREEAVFPFEYHVDSMDFVDRKGDLYLEVSRKFKATKEGRFIPCMA